MRKVGVTQEITRLVEHLILLQRHRFEVRLQGRKIVRRERGEKPVGAMAEA